MIGWMVGGAYHHATGIVSLMGTPVLDERALHKSYDRIVRVQRHRERFPRSVEFINRWLSTRLNELMLKAYPRPSISELVSLRLKPVVSDVFDEYDSLPLSLIPYYVMRQLMYNERVVINVKSDSWKLFDKIYGEAILAALG